MHLLLWCCIITFLGLSSQSPITIQPNSSVPKIVHNETDSLDFHTDLNEEQTKVNLVEEALSLIAEGETIIHLDENYKDIVLVMGNTGAGKTTISKFIAQVDDLESYDAEDRLLIRDREQKISEGSTIVSQTIFPELFIDNMTNTALYDLPGFSDTRNASVEIANAWFMKKIADHARRVKLLFIINYSSLRPGETRVDFKSFLENAIKLIKYPSTFNSSIALVATKVESRRSDKDIIRGIAYFFQTAKENVEEVFADKSDQVAATQLIDALLSTDSQGQFNRISFFRQPEDEGPLTELPEVMAQRPQILKVLYNNTVFTNTDPHDFGFSFSPAADHLLVNIFEKLQNDVAQSITRTGSDLAQICEKNILSSPLEILGEQLFQQGKLQIIASNLSASISQRQFLQNLDILNDQLKSTCFGSEDRLKLPKSFENIQFLQKISSQEFLPEFTSWALPLKNLINSAIKEALTQKSLLLSNKLEFYCKNISSQIVRFHQTRVEQTAGGVPQMEATLAELTTGSQNIQQLIHVLQQSSTVNSFLQVFQENLSGTGGSIEEPTMVLKEDINLEEGLSSLSWIKPLHEAAAFLNGEQSKLRGRIGDEKRRLAKEEEERVGREKQEEEARILRQQQEEQRRLAEEAERKRREHAETVRRMHEEAARRQRELERQRQAQEERLGWWSRSRSGSPSSSFQVPGFSISFRFGG